MLFVVYLLLILAQAGIIFFYAALTHQRKSVHPSTGPSGKKIMPWASLNEIKEVSDLKDEASQAEFKEAA